MSSKISQSMYQLDYSTRIKYVLFFNSYVWIFSVLSSQNRGFCCYIIVYSKTSVGLNMTKAILNFETNVWWTTPFWIRHLFQNIKTEKFIMAHCIYLLLNILNNNNYLNELLPVFLLVISHLGFHVTIRVN